jgi:hypothetical protein
VELVQPNLMTDFCASAGDCTTARPSESPAASFQICMSVLLLKGRTVCT